MIIDRRHPMAQPAALLAAILLVFLGGGCGAVRGHGGGYGRGSQSAKPAYAGPHVDVVGYWLIESFIQRDPQMSTCFGEDAGVEFHADGTWTGINRLQHHTYDGTYFFTAAGDVELDAGVTQRYSITAFGDFMSFRSGDALMMTLRRAERPASVPRGEASPATPQEQQLGVGPGSRGGG